MEEYKDSKDKERANKAHGFFLKMISIAEEKNIEKMSMCFYDLVKQTYGLAKDQDLYEKDKEEIDSALKGMMVSAKMILEQSEWTEDMIEEFDKRVMKLWDID